MPALVEVVFIRIAVERILDIDVQSVHRVYKLDQSIKVDEYEIGDVHAIELLQGPHGSVDTVDAGMGELIAHAVRNARDRNIVISGCGCQEDLLGLGIDRNDDVDVASAGLRDIAVNVDAADHNVEGLSYFDVSLIDTGLNTILVQNSDLVFIFVIFK